MADVDITVSMIDKTKAAGASVNQTLREMEKNSKGTKQGLGEAAATMSEVALGMARIALSATTLTAAFQGVQKAFELAEEGAQLQRLADSGSEVARQFGGDMDLIVEKVKAASQGTVSEMDIISSSNKAMMLGLGADADQLANLMEIAAFRGRAMGLSTTQAFDDIVRGVGRASPMILDNLGIVVSANETYDNYAKQLGKSAQELTKAEKTQALLNAVLESGNKLLDEAGGLVEDNASKYERLHARQKDYADSLKMTMSDAVTPGISAFLDYADAMDKASEATGMNDQRSRMYLATMQLEIEKQNEQKQAVINASTARMEGLASLYETKLATDDLVLSEEDLEAAFKATSEHLTGMIGLIDNMQSAEENYTEKSQDLADQRAEAEQKLAELKAQGADIGNAAYDEALAKLNEVKEAEANLAAEREKQTLQFVSNILQEQLARDGWTQAEFDAFAAQQEAWGLWSADVVEKARAAWEEADKITASIEAIPSSKDVFVNVQTNYSADAQSALEQQYTYGSGRASGGSVSGGMMYPVNEKGMPELLNFGGKQMLMMPESGSGYVTPLSTGTGGAGAAGGTTIINIMLDSATPDPERVAYQLAPAVERVLRSKKLI